MTTTLQNLPANAQRVALSTHQAALCSVYTYQRDGETFAAGFLAGATEPGFQGYHVSSDEGLRETIAAFARHAQRSAGKMTPRHRRDHLHAMANKPRAKWRKTPKASVIWPAPVYEAHFDSAEKVRMSFGSADGKGWDGNPATLKSLSEQRRLLQAINVWTGQPVHSSGRLVDGYVEHNNPARANHVNHETRSRLLKDSRIKAQRSALQVRSYKSRSKPAAFDTLSYWRTLYTEQASALQRSRVIRVRDLHFAPQEAAAPESQKTPAKRAKLPTGRQVAARLAALIDWLERGDGDDSALEQARAMAACFKAV